MQQILTQYALVFYLLVAWSIPWKAVALWKSARRGQMVWFIVLLVVNTFAILEIIYLIIYLGKGKPKENTQINQGNGSVRMVI